MLAVLIFLIALLVAIAIIKFAGLLLLIGLICTLAVLIWAYLKIACK